MLNECGDVTLTWQPENDAEMEKIVAAKMEAGVTFFIIAARKPGQREWDAGAARIVED
jgi:hypothetical protein